jgi:hypothetical protein
MENLPQELMNDMVINFCQIVIIFEDRDRQFNRVIQSNIKLSL